MPCEICFEEYSSYKRKPLLLRCGHDFCHECLQALRADSGDSNVVCPFCNRRENARLEDLPVVFSLIPKEIYSVPIENVDSHVCQWKSCIQLRDYFCNHCKRWLCLKHKNEDMVSIAAMSQSLVETMKRCSCQYQSLAAKHSVKGLNDIRSLELLEKEIDKLVDQLKRLQRSQKNVIWTYKANHEKMLEEFQEKHNACEDLAAKISSTKVSDQGISSNVLQAVSKLDFDLKKILSVGTESTLCSRLESDWNSSKHRLVSRLDSLQKTFDDVQKTLENNRAIYKLSPHPFKVKKLHVEPFDIAIVKHSVLGFTLSEGAVQPGMNGDAFPIPALLVRPANDKTQLLIYDEDGINVGVVRLRDINVLFLSVRDFREEILATDAENNCVWRLDLSGEPIVRTAPGVLTSVRGFCILPAEKLAVCDPTQKSVVILSLFNLEVLTYLQHPNIHTPHSVAVSESNNQLIMFNWQSDSLLTFSLEDFSFIRLSKYKFKLPSKVLIQDDSVYVTDLNRISQISSSGRRISQSSSDKLESEKNLILPIGFASYCSSSSDQVLVVVDHDGRSLHFYCLERMFTKPSEKRKI